MKGARKRGRDVFKNIGNWIIFVSFPNYRPIHTPEVTLLSPKTALNFRFRLRKGYLFGYVEFRPKKRNTSKIRNDVIIFSTSLNPAMFGTLNLSRRDVFKNI